MRASKVFAPIVTAHIARESLTQSRQNEARGRGGSPPKIVGGAKRVSEAAQNAIHDAMNAWWCC